MLDQADREAFSLAIVKDAQQIAGLQMAMASLQPQEAQDQALDTANQHLFDPVNTLINQYQAEFNLLDGNLRTSITEQNILDSANRIVGNYFYPNNTALSIPSLSALNNVWIQTTPFGLAFGIGQNYNQTYTAGTAETNLISTIQGYITSAGSNTDIVNTSGEFCNNMDTCSIPLYDGDEADCVSHSGTYFSTDTIIPYPPVQALSVSIIAAVNSLVSQLNLEVTALNAIVDSDPTRTSQNAAAAGYITGTILPALNAWLAYPAFNPVPGSVTTCSEFNSYDSSLLAPTQLHSVQLSALSSALTARSTFLSSTRVPQLNANLGTISQNITTGLFTGSGLYFNRFTYINLRLNLLTGSLTALTSDQQTLSTQSTMISNLNATINAYQAVCLTTTLSASGNGTGIVSLVNPAGFNVGDIVYITSNTQPEMQFAIKTINGNSVQLNSSLSSKFTTLDSTRFYKDLT